MTDYSNQIKKNDFEKFNEISDLKINLRLSEYKISKSLNNNNALGKLKFISTEILWWKNFFEYNPNRTNLDNFLRYRMAGALNLYELEHDDCDQTEPVLEYFKAKLLKIDEVIDVKIGHDISPSEKVRTILVTLKNGEDIYLETDTANSLMTDLNLFMNLVVKKVEGLPNKCSWPEKTYIKKLNLELNKSDSYYRPFKLFYFINLSKKMTEEYLSDEEMKCLISLETRAKYIHTLENMMLVPYGYNQKRGYNLTTYKSGIKINDRLDLTFIDYEEMINDKSFTSFDFQKRLGNKKCSKRSIEFLIKYKNMLIPNIPIGVSSFMKKNIDFITLKSKSIIDTYE